MIRRPLDTRILTNLSGYLPDGRAWLISQGDLWVGGHKIGIRARVTTEGEPGYLVELAPPFIASSCSDDHLGGVVASAARMAADPRYLARPRAVEQRGAA